MSWTEHRDTAADLAAYAAFLEIAEGLGLSSLLDRDEAFTLDEVMSAARLAEPAAAEFLKALVAAGLVQEGAEERQFAPCADMAAKRYAAGYLSWSLDANRPYIDHAPEILRDPDTARGQYRRDGRRVAVSSRWIGSQGFYPGVIEEIVSRKPRRIVDLGAGAGGLLIHLLGSLPDSTALALDLSEAACDEARRAAEEAGVGDRLEIAHRSVESLVDDASPVRGADVVHAGFVMHDVSSTPDVLDGVLRACRTSLADGGCLVVTDAVPYASGEGERSFSALFTYLHAGSMDVRLPAEDEWAEAFRRAGFSDVRCTRLPMPGSRVFVAKA
ncbi:class I SAM-dependent methyltransferase [Streptomyces sp. NPDC003554]